MAPSMEQVLDTTELLESILSHLHIRTLLLSQRVCCNWRDLITQSPTLQQNLFFLARPSDRSPDTCDAEGPEMNPLLQWLFPPLLDLNAHGSRHSFPSGDALNQMHWADTERKYAAVLRADATWRIMFPVQPPPLSLAVIQRRHGMGGDSRRPGHLSNAELTKYGVRMGLIYDVVEAELRGSPYSFFIRWHSFPLQTPKVLQEAPMRRPPPENAQINLDRFETAYGGHDLCNKVSIFFWGTISCVRGRASSPHLTPRSEGCQHVEIEYEDYAPRQGYEDDFFA